MPKFLVHRDTMVSHLGRKYLEGEIAEFEIPFVPERDVQGRVVMVDGKPKGKPMRLDGNLELLPEPPPEPPADVKKK